MVYARGWIVVSLWSWMCCLQALSQNNLFLQNGPADELFLLAPRPLMRLLREAEIAFEEQRYADGITALSAVLLADNPDIAADIRGQDYFIGQDVNGLFNQSLKGEALRLLAQLPPEGRRTLEVQLGVTARRDLSAAIAARDFEAIGAVARQYLHTDAGYDALVLWAQYKLTSGHAVSAASILQNLLEYPAARARFGSQLALDAARAWGLAGNLETAGLIMKMAATHFPGESVSVAGQQLSLDAATDWIAALKREAANEYVQSVSRSADVPWMVTGGAPERNATSAASLPLPTERWVREIHSSLPEQQAIARQSETEIQKGRVLLPKFELRMVGDLVLTKTTDASVLAIDFETGLIKWPLYFHNAPVQLTNLSYAASSGSASLSPEIQNRVWGSSAFGKFSCDEQRLYLVSEYAEQLLDSEAMFRVNERAGQTNFLEGASIQSEGAIVWRVGGSDGADEPLLAEAYFLGPPLPYQGELFCLADFKGETRLVVLDAATGRLRWKQQLVHSSNPPLHLDPERRAQALSPTIADGVILCPTGLGAVAAVDLLSRSLKWGATYPSRRRGSRRASVFGEEPQYTPLERRWQEPAMIAQDGLVLISPPEADDFQCRDILTGQLLLGPQRRNSYRYLAGLQGGTVIVVGERQIAAIDLSHGKPAWQTEYPGGLTLAGKGLWQSDSLLLPLSDRQLIRIDTRDGSIVERTQVSQPLGNLFAYRNQLLSVSSSAVCAFYTRTALAEEVAQRLAADPNDTWALNQQSQLALLDQRWEQAQSSLEKSYALDSENADTRFLLADLLLSGLQADFARFEAMAQKYGEVVEFGPQRFRFLQQLTLGKIQSGQPFEAFQRLLMLIPNIGSTFASSHERQRELELAPGYVVDSDTWIAVELARAYSQATPAERTEMDRLIAAELASTQDMLIPLQREKLRFFQWLPPATGALIELASSMLSGDERIVAEQLLEPLLHSPNPSFAETARQLLSQPSLSDRYESAWGELGMRSAAGEFPTEATQSRTTPATGWRSGLVQAQISDDSRYAYGLPLELISERHGRPELMVALSGAMVMLRTGNGIDRGRLEFSGASSDATTDELTRGTIRGGLLLIEKSSELAAFDIQRDLLSGSEALLWRHSLFNPGAAPSIPFTRQEVTSENTQLGFAISHRKMPLKQQSIVGPLTPAGVLVQTGTKLKMLSTLTGRPVWSRDGYDDSVSLAATGTEVAVIERGRGKVQILDCRDGQLVRDYEIAEKWLPWFSHQGWVVELSRTDVIPPPPTTVRVWNAFTGEELLQIESAIGSCADVCEDRYLVLLDGNSQLVYCDLGAPGKPLVQRHPVKLSQPAQSISIERFEERLVVLCSDERASVGLTEMVPVQGSVLALDARSGELLWDRPGYLSGMQFPKSQPRQSPFMIVFRTFPEREATFPASVALIDLRTGRLAYSNRWLGLHAGSGFAMSLLPQSQSILVWLGARSLRFSITDEPRPPQPVFWYGAAEVSVGAVEQPKAFSDKLFGR